MTQELVLAGLLTGLIGLLWVMTLAVWQGKHAADTNHESEHADNTDHIQHREGSLKHQTTAA